MAKICLTLTAQDKRHTKGYTIKPCPHCQGLAYVHEDIFVITRMRAEILDCFAEGYASVIVDLNEGIMSKILSEGLLSVEANNRWKDNRVYFVPHKTFKEDAFTVRGESELEPALPNKAQLLK